MLILIWGFTNSPHKSIEEIHSFRMPPRHTRNSKTLHAFWMSTEFVSLSTKQDTRRRDIVQNLNANNPDIEEATINMLQSLIARHHPTGYALMGRALFCGTLRSTSALSRLRVSLDCFVLFCITLFSFAC